ncbi:MAG: hypothetical protein AAF725_23840, partial [Acidobacteriota bacterium]
MHGVFEAPGSILRTSRAYRLVLADRLGSAERRRLGERCQEPDFYGALRRVSGEGAVRAVDRETALLLLSLREPGPIPRFFLRGGGAAKLRRTVAALIQEGALEIQGADGAFRRAAAAPGSSVHQAPSGRLARLSRAAVRWACGWARRGPGGDRRSLIRQLYAYNRLPWTPRWRRRLGGGHRPCVERYAGFPRELPAGWRPRARLESDGWVIFERSGPARPGPYKLYISPRPEGLGPALDGLFSVLADCRVAAVKVAGLSGDVLRPDKLMVYTDRLDALWDAAQRLGPALEGLEPHGVPFSAEIGGDGLLSWATDP